jgi:hypothetical protein
MLGNDDNKKVNTKVKISGRLDQYKVMLYMQKNFNDLFKITDKLLKEQEIEEKKIWNLRLSFIEGISKDGPEIFRIKGKINCTRRSLRTI